MQTKAMGMTDLCPGTHYCGNDLSTMCENTKMSLANADPSGPHFRAGDGALLNQIVWHRGATHRDPNSLERIVFIVSFLARPDVQRDPRQLSRGTYFHQVCICSRFCVAYCNVGCGSNVACLFLILCTEMEHVGPYLDRLDGSHALHAKALVLLEMSLDLEATHTFLGL